MRSRADELVPAVRKIENLLGLQFVNDEIVNDRILSIIEKDSADHGLSTIEADYSSIDWPLLVDRACFRRPPFSDGDKEKGFKDAIILECFANLVSLKPKSKTQNIIALVCQDDLMAEYAQELFRAQKQVHICRSLDDLRTVVNAIASNVTQDVADAYVEKATRIFWDGSAQKGLYQGWGIWSKISKDYARYATGGWTITSGKVSIPSTTFIKKESTRIFLKTVVTVALTATRKERKETPAISGGQVNVLGNYKENQWTNNALLAQSSTSSLLSDYAQSLAASASDPYSQVPFADRLAAIIPEYTERKSFATASFDVLWSVTVGRTGRIIRPEMTDFVPQKVDWKSS